MSAWTNIRGIMKRELGGYFTSPIAYVFLVIFLLLTGFFTFTVGNFFERGEASLVSFFTWHPWLYLFLVPAVGMRLWSEERRLGTLELLLTLPITTWQAIVGKFLASWLFLALALALTFPVVITVNWLGDPDNGVIFAGYIGSLMLAGGYLAVSCMTSAMTRNQVISFILSVMICLFLILAGYTPVTQASCRDRNRIALQGDVLGAAAFRQLRHLDRVAVVVVEARANLDGERDGDDLLDLFENRLQPRQVFEQTRAAAVLDDLGRGAAAVHVEDIGADLLGHLGGHRHAPGLAAEDLHGERALVLVKAHLPLRLRVVAR